MHSVEKHIRLIVNSVNRQIIGHCVVFESFLLCSYHTIDFRSDCPLEVELYSVNENLLRRGFPVTLVIFHKYPKLDLLLFKIVNPKMLPFPKIDFEIGIRSKSILVTVKILSPNQNGILTLNSINAWKSGEIKISKTQIYSDNAQIGEITLVTCYEGWMFKSFSGSPIIDSEGNIISFVLGNLPNSKLSFVSVSLFENEKGMSDLCRDLQDIRNNKYI